MRFGSFVVDYGELMASRYDPLAVAASLLHGLFTPAL
jgi:hypothetical protein